MSERLRRVCDVCDNPAVCVHKAGLGCFFVRKDGSTYHDPDRDCFLCDVCCGHSGEEGECYSVVNGESMCP
jgi:hypothetical protein